MLKGFTAKASIEPDPLCFEDIDVDLTFEKQEITSAQCSVCPAVSWCEHILAAVLYHIKHIHKVGFFKIYYKCMTLSCEQRIFLNCVNENCQYSFTFLLPQLLLLFFNFCTNRRNF